MDACMKRVRNQRTTLYSGSRTRTLVKWVGSGGQSGGLNPLYQIGGPRSVQLAPYASILKGI